MPGGHRLAHLENGEDTTRVGVDFLSLIPKSTTDTRGVVLLETLWKVVEALIDTHLRASLQFHYVLHWFQIRRGTGTAIMDLKLAQELARVDHDPLLLVFLDFHKAYNTGDR